MTAVERTIDLLTYRGTGSSYFTGRPQGEEVRDKLKLDLVDSSQERIVFEIPEGTTSFNPSFYLGLLYDSFKKLGQAKFREKYTFKILDKDPAIQGVLERNLEDALRSAIITYNNKGGFKRFT